MPRHLPACRACDVCGVHACYHIYRYKDRRQCWIDVRGPACGEDQPQSGFGLELGHANGDTVEEVVPEAQCGGH